MSKQPDQPTLYHEPPLQRNVSFHLLWSSVFASGFGDRLAMLAAMVLLGYGLAGIRISNASLAAGIEFFFFLPYVVWGPFAGWLADRLPRKWIMFFSDELRGLLVLLALTMVPSDMSVIADVYQPWLRLPLGFATVVLIHAWKVWAIMFGIGFMAATFNPARTAIVPSVVGMRWLQRANAVAISFGVVGNLLGFIFGGPLAESRIRWCVFIAAACYIVSGWFWVFLTTPYQRHNAVERAKAAGNPWTDMLSGLRYIRRHRPVLVLVGVEVVFWAGSTVFLAALATINREMYAGTTASYAYLMGAMGLGVLLGAVLLGIFNLRWGSEWITVVALIGTAVTMALQMLVPVFWLGLVLALAAGLCGGVLMVNITTLTQRIAPDHMRGRIVATRDMLSMVSKVIMAWVIWANPDADASIGLLVYLLSVVLLVMALLGVKYYIMPGPHPDGFCNGVWRLARLFAEGWHQLRIVGRWRLPGRGPVLLVSNHTSGLDPVLLQVGQWRTYRWMMLESYRFQWLNMLWRRIRPICVMRSNADSAAVRDAVKALDAGEVLVVFPEGGIEDVAHQMQGFLPGVGLIARRTDPVIVPVFISGTKHSYNVLVSYLWPSRSRVIFGPAFRVADIESELDGSIRGRDRLQAIADGIHHRIEQLREQVMAGAVPAFND